MVDVDGCDGFCELVVGPQAFDQEVCDGDGLCLLCGYFGSLKTCLKTVSARKFEDPHCAAFAATVVDAASTSNEQFCCC